MPDRTAMGKSKVQRLFIRGMTQVNGVSYAHLMGKVALTVRHNNNDAQHTAIPHR